MHPGPCLQIPIFLILTLIETMTKKNKNKIKNKIKIKIILTLQILSRRFTSLKRGIHLQHDDSMQGALERGEKKKAKTHEQSME